MISHNWIQGLESKSDIFSVIQALYDPPLFNLANLGSQKPKSKGRKEFIMNLFKKNIQLAVSPASSGTSWKTRPPRTRVCSWKTRQSAQVSTPDLVHGDGIWAGGLCLVSCQPPPTLFLACRSGLSFLSSADVVAAECACLPGRQGRDLWEPFGLLQSTS